MHMQLKPGQAKPPLLERGQAATQSQTSFTGLLSTRRAHLYAISAIHGSHWRIDLNARRATKLQMAAPLKGTCALGLAIQDDIGRSSFHHGLAPPLHLCASTKSGPRRIEVTGLAQATGFDESCSPK